jgi:DNA-binding HxlR family transcriptional regulator
VLCVAKAAARKGTGPVPSEQDCPVLTGAALQEFKATVRAANDLSMAMLRFLEGRPVEEQAAWLRTSVDAGRVLFQPWSMEVLFTLGASKEARFNELHALLGMSTRTLSDKLQALREAGFVERTVHDEQPVRITYRLTKDGRAAAALATPLFTHLNLQALRAAGRLPPRSPAARG